MRRMAVVTWAVLWAALLAGGCWRYPLPGEGRSAEACQVVVTSVQVGSYPHGLAVDPERNRIYVADMNGDQLSVIDGDTDRVMAIVRVGKGPRDVAVNARTGRIYVAELGLYGLENLTWLGLRLYRPLFAAAVVDGQANDVLAHVVVGVNPWVVQVSEAANRVYVGNYSSSNVSVIDGESNEVVEEIDLGRFYVPHSIAPNAPANRIYVGTSRHLGPIDAGGGKVLVVDAGSNQVLGTIRVGSRPYVAVNGQTNRVYVTSRGSDTLSVFDGSTNERIAGVQVGSEPCGLAVDETRNLVYVANRGEASLTVVDGSSNQVLCYLEVGASPMFVAVNEVTGHVYVTHPESDTVSILRPVGETWHPVRGQAAASPCRRCGCW
jgi:YVTN family beta-propeller protein